MPSPILTESIALEIGGQEPWPHDVKLYQPYEIEQILLPDNANCLAVQAYLRMCGLPYQVESRSNAEFMSPSGSVPFIKCGKYVIAELEPIVSFVENKGISLTSNFDDSQKNDMKAYISLINFVLGNSELYVCWADKETYNTVTKPRYSSVYPWPLNHLQTTSKRSSIIKHLKAVKYYNKTIEEVYQEVEQCYRSLSDRLDDKEYFFGSNPTEVDALLFGHLYCLNNSENYRFLNIIEEFPYLQIYYENIWTKYFSSVYDFSLVVPDFHGVPVLVTWEYWEKSKDKSENYIPEYILDPLNSTKNDQIIQEIMFDKRSENNVLAISNNQELNVSKTLLQDSGFSGPKLVCGTADIKHKYLHLATLIDLKPGYSNQRKSINYLKSYFERKDSDYSLDKKAKLSSVSFQVTMNLSNESIHSIISQLSNFPILNQSEIIQHFSTEELFENETYTVLNDSTSFKETNILVDKSVSDRNIDDLNCPDYHLSLPKLNNFKLKLTCESKLPSLDQKNKITSSRIRETATNDDEPNVFLANKKNTNDINIFPVQINLRSEIQQENVKIEKERHNSLLAFLTKRFNKNNITNIDSNDNIRPIKIKTLDVQYSKKNTESKIPSTSRNNKQQNSFKKNSDVNIQSNKSSIANCENLNSNVDITVEFHETPHVSNKITYKKKPILKIFQSMFKSKSKLSSNGSYSLQNFKSVRHLSAGGKLPPDPAKLKSSISKKKVPKQDSSVTSINIPGSSNQNAIKNDTKSIDTNTEDSEDKSQILDKSNKFYKSYSSSSDSTKKPSWNIKENKLQHLTPENLVAWGQYNRQKDKLWTKLDKFSISFSDSLDSREYFLKNTNQEMENVDSTNIITTNEYKNNSVEVCDNKIINIEEILERLVQYASEVNSQNDMKSDIMYRDIKENDLIKLINDTESKEKAKELLNILESLIETQKCIVEDLNNLVDYFKNNIDKLDINLIQNLSTVNAILNAYEIRKINVGTQTYFLENYQSNEGNYELHRQLSEQLLTILELVKKLSSASERSSNNQLQTSTENYYDTEESETHLNQSSKTTGNH